MRRLCPATGRARGTGAGAGPQRLDIWLGPVQVVRPWAAAVIRHTLTTMRLARRFRPGPKDQAHEAEPTLEVREIGRRAASGATLLAARGVFQQVLGLFATIVITRMLLPSELGTFAIATTIAGVLWMLGGGQGMAGALIRSPTAPERADLRVYVGLQLAIMIALAGVVVLCTLPFGRVGEITAVMVAVTPISAFRGAGVVTIERQLLYRKLATAETFELLVYYVWSVAAVWVGWGVWGLATAVVARTIVGTAVIIWLAPTRFIWPSFERARARALLGMGGRVQAVEVVSALKDQVLITGTAALGGLAVVAYYNVVLRVLQAPKLLIVALLRVSFPAMSQVQASDGDAQRLLPRILSTSAIFFGLLLAPLAGAAPAFVPLLLGDKWSPAGDVLPLVCLGVVVITPMTIGCQGYLWAIGDAKSPLRAGTADAVVFCAVSLPLVPFLGVLALAIGLVVATFVHSVVLARAITAHTGVRPGRVILLPVLLWVVATGAAWICAETAGPLLVRTVVSAGVGFLLYLALLVPTHRELTHEALGFARPWLRRRLARGWRLLAKLGQRRRRHRPPARESGEVRPAPASAAAAPPTSSRSETVTSP